MATRRPIGRFPSAGGGGHQRSILHQATVTLTNDQIIHLPSTGIQIVAAPGSGKIICVERAIGILDNATAAYTDTAGAHFQFSLSTWLASSSLDENAQLVFQDGTGAPHQLSWISSTDHGDGQWIGDKADVANQPLMFKSVGSAGNFTGGNVDNSLILSVTYLILNTSTGQFE